MSITYPTGKRIARALLTIGMVASAHFLAGSGFYWLQQKIATHRPTTLEMVGMTIFFPPFLPDSPWLARVLFSLIFSLACCMVIGPLWRRLTRMRFIWRVTVSGVIGGALVYVILSCFWFLSALLQFWPHEVSRVSTGFHTRQQKIEFLTRQMKTDSPLIDTEYAIYISTGLGPSNYDLHIAYKVAPQDVDRWIDKEWQPATRQEVEQFDPTIRCVGLASKPREEDEHPSGFYRVPNLNAQTWRHTSKAEYYKYSHHNFLVVYRKEGILIYTSRSD